MHQQDRRPLVKALIIKVPKCFQDCTWTGSEVMLQETSQSTEKPATMERFIFKLQQILYMKY